VSAALLAGLGLARRQWQRHHAHMPRVLFTPQLKRFTETPEVHTPAATLRAALEAAFALNPRLRGYVLDDQGHLRANVVAFIDGRRCTDRVVMDDPLQPDSTVYVLQALSGG
jgi:sulfur-carrier protein